MPEDVGWRGGLGWFHTACHGLLVGAITAHAAVRPNAVHLQIWAFATCIFGMRLVCNACLEKLEAENAGARLLVLQCFGGVFLATQLQLDDPLELLRENLDSPLLNNFIWMVMGLTNAVQPVPTRERLSILVLFCFLTFMAICKICATAPTFDRVMLRATLCYTIVPFVTGYCGTHLTRPKLST